MYGALDISTSGMIAERTRMTVISANLAHRNTILDSEGNVNPYRRREVYFAPGDPSSRTAMGRALGVHVAEIRANEEAIRYEYQPSSPYAYRDGPRKGYVPIPDIDPITEQVNALEAARAYEANVAAAEATKSMMAQALRLIA